jgi:hypothetical protein
MTEKLRCAECGGVPDWEVREDGASNSFVCEDHKQTAVDRPAVWMLTRLLVVNGEPRSTSRETLMAMWDD